MKLILSSIAFFSFSILYAQVKVTINGKDTTVHIASLFNGSQASMIPSSKMPNALEGFKDNQQLMGNNQQGFDIYQSQVDNMNVLKPDAANLASLANEKYRLNTVLQSCWGTIEVHSTPSFDNHGLQAPKSRKFKLDKLPY